MAMSNYDATCASDAKTVITLDEPVTTIMIAPTDATNAVHVWVHGLHNTSDTYGCYIAASTREYFRKDNRGISEFSISAIDTEASFAWAAIAKTSERG